MDHPKRPKSPTPTKPGTGAVPNHTTHPRTATPSSGTDPKTTGPKQSSTSPELDLRAIRMEVESFRQKITSLVGEKTAKAAIILSEWTKKSPSDAESPAKKQKQSSKKAA